MDLLSAVPGLAELRSRTLGDPSVRVAVLDGPVDLAHPCFDGADLHQSVSLVPGPVEPGRMSRHGTHVASLLFGQPGSPVAGLAPRTTGILVPIFRETEDAYVPQLDLARALEQAVIEGAHVVNISGGEPSASAEADLILERVLRSCEQQNVLVVAAAGNDGCACLHVPAAVPTVLAVGAQGRDGSPLPSSNWGEGYRSHGVLTLGQSVEGAAPGGGTQRMSGTSIATPVVAGVAALLLSVQRATQGRIDPAAVRDAILATARPCPPGQPRGVRLSRRDPRRGRGVPAPARAARPRRPRPDGEHLRRCACGRPGTRGRRGQSSRHSLGHRGGGTDRIR